MVCSKIIEDLFKKAKPIFYRALKDHKRFLIKNIKEASKEGFFAEFGVHRGVSLNMIAESTNKIVYGFDSFQGLPEEWAKMEKGAFKLKNGAPKGVLQDLSQYLNWRDNSESKKIKPWPNNIEIVEGWFEDTLPVFVKREEIKNTKVSFLHIDCDLYSSTKTIFDYLGDKIQDGTILVFDEIYGYKGYEEHELKAFAEFLEKFGFSYEPLYIMKGKIGTVYNGGMTQGSFKIKKR